MLTEEELTGINNMLKRLIEAPNMTADKLERLRHDRSLKRAIETMERGGTYGEAMGYPSMYRQPEDTFRNELQSKKDDIQDLLKLLNEFLDLWFEKGEYPPPYYATRLAILLRKNKVKELEAAFLAAYCRHFNAAEKGAANVKLLERARKLGAIQ